MKEVQQKLMACYLGLIGIAVLLVVLGETDVMILPSMSGSAEFVAQIRNLFESNDIRYQIGELGKVDIGGGGTIAYILADKGIDVIDCGVPVLSMHAPYEVTSKYDIYSAYKTYEAFWKE